MFLVTILRIEDWSMVKTNLIYKILRYVEEQLAVSKSWRGKA